MVIVIFSSYIKLPEGMGSPEPPPWFLIFLPRHFSNSWAPPGTSRISSWPSSHSSGLRLARHADAVLKHRWWLFHLGFYGEWTNLSLLKIGKSPTKWRHQVSLGDSKNAGYGLLQFMAIFWFETWWLNHEFLLSFFLSFFFERTPYGSSKITCFAVPQ